MVPLALGTQTTSSMIRLASCCGVVGFVPTLGDVTLSGVRASSGSLGRIGVFARSVGDIALYFDVLRCVPPGPSPEEATFAPRIGHCRGFLAERMEPGTDQRLETLAIRLSAAGAEVADVALPPEFLRLTDEHRWISSFEFVRNFTYEIENHWDRISTTLSEGRIAHGLSCSREQYLAARRQAPDVRRPRRGRGSTRCSVRTTCCWPLPRRARRRRAAPPATSPSAPCGPYSVCPPSPCRS